MYIIIRNDLVIYKGNDLQYFLYDRFEAKLIEGNIYIRPREFNFYVNKDYEKMPMSYSNEYSAEEMFNDFVKTKFLNYAKKYDYEFYKSCEQL